MFYSFVSFPFKSSISQEIDSHFQIEIDLKWKVKLFNLENMQAKYFSLFFVNLFI